MPEPPYARIAAELSRRITDRELAVGDKVPSTRQVAEEFNVALATAVKALDVLRREGLVVSRPRSGTRVAARGRTSRPATRELDRDRVVAEAVALADAEGLAAVSMRAVAHRCGVAPMTLYRHIDGKDELVLQMADRVYGEALPNVDETGEWRRDLEALCWALWRSHRAHPWLGQIQPLTRPLPVPNLLSFGDKMLGALEGLALPPKRRFDIHVLLYSHITSLASNLEHEDSATSETGLSAEEWTDLRYLPITNDETLLRRYPHFGGMLRYFGVEDGYDLDLDEMFALGLRLTLDGAATMAAEEGP